MLRQFHRNRRAIMSKIKTDDGTEIFFKDSPWVATLGGRVGYAL
jgi:hypothetical protein